ncbi:MAG: CHAD domain-containing protein [Polyangiaceae bacterium]
MIAVVPATVGPYLTAKLRALDGRLGLVVPRVISTTPDEEAVHDLRVALRRTRTVLEVGRSVFGPFHADEVRGALRDLQRATGSLRDEEVLLELIASLKISDPDVQGWLEVRRRRERAIRRALVRLIEAGELDRGRRLLEALLAFRVEPARDKRLDKFARRAVARARRRIERRRGAHPDDPIALHELRIAYKRLRYVVEIFSEALPSQLSGLAQPASRLQSLLGSVHDVDVVLASVKRARSLSHESRRQLLGALTRLREEKTVRYQAEAGLLDRLPKAPVQASGTDSLRKTSTR